MYNLILSVLPCDYCTWANYDEEKIYWVALLHTNKDKKTVNKKYVKNLNKWQKKGSRNIHNKLGLLRKKLEKTLLKTIKWSPFPHRSTNCVCFLSNHFSPHLRDIYYHTLTHARTHTQMCITNCQYISIFSIIAIVRPRINPFFHIS